MSGLYADSYRPYPDSHGRFVAAAMISLPPFLLNMTVNLWLSMYLYVTG